MFGPASETKSNYIMQFHPKALIVTVAGCVLLALGLRSVGLADAVAGIVIVAIVLGASVLAVVKMIQRGELRPYGQDVLFSELRRLFGKRTD